MASCPVGSEDTLQIHPGPRPAPACSAAGCQRIRVCRARQSSVSLSLPAGLWRRSYVGPDLTPGPVREDLSEHLCLAALHSFKFPALVPIDSSPIGLDDWTCVLVRPPNLDLERRQRCRVGWTDLAYPHPRPDRFSDWRGNLAVLSVPPAGIHPQSR